MPLVEVSKDRTEPGDCAEIKCGKKISTMQAYVRCDACDAVFHPRCLGVQAKNIKSEPVIFCNDLCKSSYSSKKSQNLSSSELPPQSDVPVPVLDFSEFSNDKIGSYLKEICASLSCIVKSQSFLSNSFDDMNIQLKKALQENTKLKKDINAIKDQQKQFLNRINDLEYEVDALNQEKLNSGCLIFGIPKSSDAPLETLKKIATKIDSTAANNIVDCYLLERKNKINSTNNINKTNNKPPLLINFNSAEAKLEFINKKKEYKQLFASQLGIKAQSEDSQIFIRSQITAYKRNLLSKARDLKQKMEAAFVWLDGSRILFKMEQNSKTTEIRTERDIDSILMGKVFNLNNSNFNSQESQN